MSAGHRSGETSLCVSVCLVVGRRRRGGGGSARLRSGVCSRARACPDARAPSITRRDISTTKRLQSNRPINLISARICQGKERGPEEKRNCEPACCCQTLHEPNREYCTVSVIEPNIGLHSAAAPHVRLIQQIVLKIISISSLVLSRGVLETSLTEK